MVGKDHVSKQDIGIPQGMNASPFLSNLYLFMYELRFMKHRESAAQYSQYFVCPPPDLMRLNRRPAGRRLPDPQYKLSFAGRFSVISRSFAGLWR